MTTAEPVPSLDVAKIAANQLAKGIVLPRMSGPNRATFKTIEHVHATKGKHPKIIATYTDGDSNSWPPDTLVLAVAASLPAIYWRAKYEALHSHATGLVKTWRHTAINLGKPNHDGHESPGIRDGRARQARICAAALENAAKAVAS